MTQRRYNNEAGLSAAIVKALCMMDGIRCQKMKGTAFGKPTLDILGSKNGMFFWLEVKQPGGCPTDRQFLTMREWIKDGAVATWTTSVRGAIDFVSEDWSGLTKEKMLEGFHGE